VFFVYVKMNLWYTKNRRSRRESLMSRL